jgi:hypothetical protein
MAQVAPNPKGCTNRDCKIPCEQASMMNSDWVTISENAQFLLQKFFDRAVDGSGIFPEYF